MDTPQKLATATVLALALTVSSAWAAPMVFIPLGTGNQVIAVDAAIDRITASYADVIDAHGLVVTPDGEYLVAGSLKETPAAAGSPADAPTSKLYLARKFHRTPVKARTALPVECPFIEVSNLDGRAGNAESELYRTG